MEAYLIESFGGQWEDSWSIPIKVVWTEERAVELVKILQKESDDYDDLMSYYENNPEAIPEHLYDTEYMGEVECSLECKACDIERYWPDMHHTTYRYTVVDSEV